MRAADPIVTLLLVLVIGIVAGILFDRLAGPSWLARQFSGSTRGIITSALVGVAGAFVGYHIAMLARRRAGDVGGRRSGRRCRGAVRLANGQVTAGRNELTAASTVCGIWRRRLNACSSRCRKQHDKSRTLTVGATADP